LFAYGPADATAIPQTPPSLASFKCRLVLPFWYRLTQVVLAKRPLNRRSRYLVDYRVLLLCLQCFDAVGWAAGRASGL